WGVWPIGGACLALHAWEDYRFTGDETFLVRRSWPILRGAAEFILDFLVEAPAGVPAAGKLVTNPSHSPENAYLLPDGSAATFTFACTMDLQVIRELLEACVHANDLCVA